MAVAFRWIRLPVVLAAILAGGQFVIAGGALQQNPRVPFVSVQLTATVPRVPHSADRADSAAVLPDDMRSNAMKTPIGRKGRQPSSQQSVPAVAAANASQSFRFRGVRVPNSSATDAVDGAIGLAVAPVIPIAASEDTRIATLAIARMTAVCIVGLVVYAALLKGSIANASRQKRTLAAFPHMAQPSTVITGPVQVL
eukprot:TRINITY_DN3443_c0_g1_i2.p1 TRINITY_DN3443_c0_g1~~TRINITY_DN3443_c0_g1_i2.p1  ORF type:complete len:197 (+),score=30.40 TRINITY_DN3443_c0_g1_i2:116-706(+)